MPINKELISPFVDSAISVLKTMAQIDAVASEPSFKEGHLTWGDVTGLIGLTNDSTQGNMSISFDKSCVLKIVSNMLMEQFEQINDDVVDAVGEITNMICGGTKKNLAEIGLSLSMTTPTVITGKDVSVTSMCKTPVISILFRTDSGCFVIESSLTELK